MKKIINLLVVVALLALISFLFPSTAWYVMAIFLVIIILLLIPHHLFLGKMEDFKILKRKAIENIRFRNYISSIKKEIKIDEDISKLRTLTKKIETIDTKSIMNKRLKQIADPSLHKVINYIHDSFEVGGKRAKIEEKLIKEGHTPEQISEAFKKYNAFKKIKEIDLKIQSRFIEETKKEILDLVNKNSIVKLNHIAAKQDIPIRNIMNWAIDLENEGKLKTYIEYGQIFLVKPEIFNKNLRIYLQDNAYHNLMNFLLENKKTTKEKILKSVGIPKDEIEKLIADLLKDNIVSIEAKKNKEFIVLKKRTNIKAISDISIQARKLYPKWPKFNHVNRVEIEMEVARILEEKNGSFSLRDVFENVLSIYGNKISKKEMFEVFYEIREWILDSSICKNIESREDVQYYKMLYF